MVASRSDSSKSKRAGYPAGSHSSGEPSCQTQRVVERQGVAIGRDERGITSELLLLSTRCNAPCSSASTWRATMPTGMIPLSTMMMVLTISGQLHCGYASHNNTCKDACVMRLVCHNCQNC